MHPALSRSSTPVPAHAPSLRRSSARGLAAVLTFALALVGWGAAGPAAAATERGPAVHAVPAAPDSARVIVRFKAGSSLERAQSATGASASAAAPQHALALSQRLGVTLTDGAAVGPRTQVLTARGISSTALVAVLAADSDVEYAEVDQRRRAFTTPNDPRYPSGQTTTPVVGQWYLQAPSSSVPAAVNAEAAWAVTLGSASVTVAVLDTGIRFDHPDFKRADGTSKLYAGYDFITDAETANDGGGRDADASDPGDWITTAENASGPFKDCGAENSSWHGTQTAGLIGAATDNGIGMASLGREVMILPVRVLGKCGGYDSDIQAAMRWAAGLSVPGVPDNTHPAKVISMSLGSAGACTPGYQNAIAEVNAAGAMVVVSAGNDGLAVATPANCPGAVAVGGVRHTGTKVGYSDLGPEVALSAPAGNCVNLSGSCLYPLLTTANTGTTSPLANTYTDGDVRPTLGTSFSGPLVAATAALISSVEPSLTPAQVLTLLKSTTRPFPSSGADSTVAACHAPTSVAQGDECYCTTSTCGAGLLDAGAALVAAAAQVVVHPAITLPTTAVVAGTAFTLDGGSSTVPSSATITSYAWSLVSGAATFTSATNAATVTLLPSAAGTVVVSLLVTDSLGNSASIQQPVTVAAAAVVTTPTPTETSSSSGGGGGGAIGGMWLLLMALAVLAAWRVTQRDR